MKRFPLVIPLLSLALLGAGCSLPNLGLGSAKPPDGGVWRSADAGITWAQANVFPQPAPKPSGSIGGANVFVIAQDPKDAKVVYLGTRENGVLASADGSATWNQPEAPSLRSGAVAGIAIDPKASCTIYVAKGAHLLKSTDCLKTADDQAYVETRPKVNVVAVQVDWYNPNVVWIGLDNGDVLKSMDGAKTWRAEQTAKGAVVAIRISNRDSRIVLVATDRAGFLRTFDAGTTWNATGDELNNFRNGTRVLALSQDKTGGTLLAATGYGLLRSHDFGATWEGLTLLTMPGQVTIKALALEPGNANHISYATLGTFYRSNDGGKTWNTQTLPSARVPEVMSVDLADPSVLFIGVATEKK